MLVVALWLHGQRAKAKQTTQAPATRGQMMAGLRHKPNACIPLVVWAQLAPLEAAVVEEACSPWVGQACMTS